MLNKPGIIQLLVDGHTCKYRGEAFEKAGEIRGVDLAKISD
jgi:hypothetical protein